MPDEDKFERALHGKGWRRVYRLARGNAPLSYVVDASMSAVAYAMRQRLSCPSVARISNVVYDSLASRIQQGEGGLFGSSEPFNLLSDELNRIQDEEFGCVATQLAVYAAEETYAELESRGGRPDHQQVEACLAERFVKLSPSFNPRERRLHPLRAMEWQAYRVKRGLAAGDSWGGLVREFIELKRVVAGMCRQSAANSAELQKTLLRLYSQYVAEWNCFSARDCRLVTKRSA